MWLQIRRKRMFSKSKKLFLFQIIQKKSKLFVLSILVSLCFLFTPFSAFAAWRDDVVPVANEIEEKILPKVLDKQTQIDFEQLLETFRGSDNPLLVGDVAISLMANLLQIADQNSDPELAEHIKTINSALTWIMVEPYEELTNRFQTRVEQYLKEYFGDDFIRIEFFDKEEGFRFGYRVKVYLNSLDVPIDYYVKTHMGGFIDVGHMSSHMTIENAALREVDPKELFIYDLLDRIGIGSETHIFFGEGATDFYIMTRDAGFDRATKTQGRFLSYSELMKGSEFSSAREEILKASAQWEQGATLTCRDAIEAEKGLGDVAQSIVHNLSAANIWSNLFLVTDVIEHGPNFGFMLHESSLPKLKLLDFIAPDSKRHTWTYMRNYRDIDLGLYDARVFPGSLDVDYRNTTDGVSKYVLRLRNLSLKILAAKKIIAMVEAGEIPLNNETIDAANAHVQEILRKCPGFEDRERELDDLDCYARGIKYNLEKFREDLSLFYTDDYILSILERLLPEDNFVVIPPAAAMLGHAELLDAALRNAIVEAINGNVVVMPIHIHSNHWVGTVFRHQANGVIQVIYIDPQGDPMVGYKQGEIKKKIRGIIAGMYALPDANYSFVNLWSRQQGNGYDCGPFTVDNLVRIARNAARLDGLNRNEIFATAELRQPLDGNARDIRAEHDAILNPPVPSEESAVRLDEHVPVDLGNLAFPTGSNEPGNNATSFFADETWGEERRVAESEIALREPSHFYERGSLR